MVPLWQWELHQQLQQRRSQEKYKEEQAQDEMNASDGDVTMVYTTTHYVGLGLYEGMLPLTKARSHSLFVH